MEDKSNRGYTENLTRTVGIRNRFLVTTEQGSWIALNKKEYDLFRMGKIKGASELFRELEERGIIITRNNIGKVIEDYRKRKNFLFQGTSLHIVVPTLRCNQRCIYCHSKSKPENAKGFDMDEDTARGVVDFVFQSPSKVIHIEFQGGEPLLNFPVMQYIIEYALEKNKEAKKELRLSVVSNLTKMDDDMARYLTKIGGLGICTSFDGPKEVHDKNRIYLNGSGTYEDVLYWIKRLKEEFGYRHLNALIVTTKFSLPYWKEIVDEYVNLGFENIWPQYMNNLGYAQSVWDKISYRPEEYIDYWRNIVDYIVKEGKPIKEVFTEIILKKILRKEDPLMVDIMSPCGAAIGQLAYDQFGDIYTCDEARMYDIFKLGNVRENSYKEVLSSPQACSIVSSSTNDVYLCDSCAWKPYCGVCPVCSYATQGNLISKLPLDYRCRILKNMFYFVFEKFIFETEYQKTFSDWIDLNNKNQI